MNIEDIKLLKSVLRKVEFNDDNVIIDIFYLKWFREHFPLVLLQNDENNREMLNDKYYFERFDINIELFETYFSSLCETMNQVRIKLKKELLVKAQIESLKNVDFNSLVGQNAIPLDDDIIDKISNLTSFEYQDELEEAYKEIQELTEEPQVAPEGNFYPEDRVYKYDDLVNHQISQQPQVPYPIDDRINSMDAIEVKPMKPVEDDLELHEGVVFGPDDDIPC